MSLTLLKSFAKVEFDGTTSTALKLTIVSGGDGTTDVYLQDSTDTNNFIYVVIENFSVTFDSNIKNERKWDYSITLVETALT